MLIYSKQVRRHTTQNTSILFILIIFNYKCMRMKIMYFCIICITNWDMKDNNFWTLFTTDILSIHLIIEIFFSWNETCLNTVIGRKKPFYLAVWTSNLNFHIFRFHSDCFPLVMFFGWWIVFFQVYIYWVLIWTTSELLQPIIF